MAIPTPVNGQITDSVTQTNVKVLGDAPAYALGALYQAFAHSLGVALENAVASQQQANTLAQAVASTGARSILGS